jgi:Amino acid synthesis
MAKVDIRKTLLNLESVFHEGGPRPSEPIKIGVAAAIIRNPFAGSYIEDIAPFMEDLAPLGIDLAQSLLAAMGGSKESIESYGKAAIVGINGEFEHAALWHVPGGNGLRQVLGAKSFVPSAKMLGAPGVRLMIPLLHVNTIWVRSHYGVAEFTVHDAPRPNEIAVAIAMSTGGRVHARIGGLTKTEAEAGLGPQDPGGRVS